MSNQDDENGQNKGGPKDPKIVPIDEARQRLRFTFHGLVESVQQAGGSDLIVNVSFAMGLVGESYYVDRALLQKDGKPFSLAKGSVINFNVASGFEKWTVPNEVGEPVDTGMGFQRITAIRLVNNS